MEACNKDGYQCPLCSSKFLSQRNYRKKGDTFMQHHKTKYTNLNDSDGIKCFSFVKGGLTLYS